MKTSVIISFFIVLTAVMTGCMTKTAYIRPGEAQVVAGFSEDDIAYTIDQAIHSIISQDRIKPAGNSPRAIMIINDVTNDTLSRGRDAGALAEALGLSLREKLTESGKVIVYNESVAQHAKVKVTPQYMLYGRLVQRTLRQDDGDIQIEYNLNLQLVDLATGLEFWQKRVPLRKLADRRNVM